MDDKNYRFEDLKELLRVAKVNGEKPKKWRLKPWQVDYIQQCGCKVEPYSYTFKTKQFKNIKNQPKIIKDIHYAYKRGKKMMGKRLNDEEKQILKEYGIKFRPDRFIVYLK